MKIERERESERQDPAAAQGEAEARWGRARVLRRVVMTCCGDTFIKVQRDATLWLMAKEVRPFQETEREGEGGRARPIRESHVARTHADSVCVAHNKSITSALEQEREGHFISLKLMFFRSAF